MVHYSNYPNGFPNGVTLRNVPIVQSNPGQIYWVSNNTTGLLTGQVGGSNGNKGTFNAPFATLQYAISQCVANRGDIIFIKPGHAETVSSATAMNWNIAGVAIVGLGVGSNRPKFTLDTANTSTITVSADNISVQNCQFFANFLSIAACFTLTTAKWFTCQGNYFRDTSNVLNFLSWINSTGAANTVDGLTLADNVVNGLGTTSVTSFLVTANDIDALTLQRNNVKLARTATAAVLATVTAGVLTNLVAQNNVAISQQTADTGGGLINVGGTTSTGIVSGNYLGDLSTTDLLMTTTVGVTFMNNYKSGVISASGYLLPAADS